MRCANISRRTSKSEFGWHRICDRKKHRQAIGRGCSRSSHNNLPLPVFLPQALEMASRHLFNNVLSSCRWRTVPSLVVALAILRFATDVLAQERQVLPPAQQSPAHSKVDMSTL